MYDIIIQYGRIIYKNILVWGLLSLMLTQVILSEAFQRLVPFFFRMQEYVRILSSYVLHTFHGSLNRR